MKTIAVGAALATLAAVATLLVVERVTGVEVFPARALIAAAGSERYCRSEQGTLISEKSP